MIFAGLDLGKQRDPTVLAVLDRVPLEAPSRKRRWRYEVVHLRPWELNTRYTAIARDLHELYAAPPLAGTTLVPDFGGVGQAVVDQLRAAKVRARLVPVAITGGRLAHFDEKNRTWNVPKVELVGTLQVLLQAELVKWNPRLPHADRLRRELANFRVTVTRAANETFAADAGQTDDVVLAVMLAAWIAERDGGDPSGVGVPAAGRGSVLEAAPDGVFAADVEHHRGRWPG